MGGGLLEGRAAQSVVARLAPPFDRGVVEPGLGEMMRDRFRLAGPLADRAEFGGAPVQRLPAALQQALVRRVLDQRVLEAIFSLRRSALDKQQIGVGKPIQ